MESFQIGASYFYYSFSRLLLNDTKSESTSM